jgi:glycine/D-amino acid oxidase-like deaminating enzyme
VPTLTTTTDTAADLVVIGAGIVGLAHAAEALARGLRVHVIERDERAVGASVRNFGHVCATAQSGRALTYALSARERWIALGARAGFEVLEAGTVVVARTEAELAVLEEFAAARGAGQARLLDADATRGMFPPATADATWWLDDDDEDGHQQRKPAEDHRSATGTSGQPPAVGRRHHDGTHRAQVRRTDRHHGSTLEAGPGQRQHQPQADERGPCRK